MGYCLLQQLGISIHLGRGLSGVYPGSIIHYCGIKRAFCNLLWDLLIYNSKEKCRHNMRFIGRTCYWRVVIKAFCVSLMASWNCHQLIVIWAPMPRFIMYFRHCFHTALSAQTVWCPSSDILPAYIQREKRPDPIRRSDWSNGSYTQLAMRRVRIDISPASARSVDRLTEAPPEDSLRWSTPPATTYALVLMKHNKAQF